MKKHCKIQQVRLFFSCAELPHFLGANTLSASVGFCLALRVQAALRSLYSLTLLFFLFWALKFSLSEKKVFQGSFSRFPVGSLLATLYTRALVKSGAPSGCAPGVKQNVRELNIGNTKTMFFYSGTTARLDSLDC